MQKSQLIQDVAVFDVYEGHALENEQKAYTLSFVLQGHDRTLDDKTVDRVMERLINAFEVQLGAQIRK